MQNIDIDLYCDEIKESSIMGPLGENESWIYIGVLIIPRNKKMQIFSDLMKCRCKNANNWHECDLQCAYHQKNGKEIHYQDINSAEVYFIANRWIDYFIDSESICFYSIGINVSRLNYSFFGDAKGSERYYRVYNRFFRTAIQKSTKSFYHNSESITIHNIYHDSADVAGHEYFPWHSIYKIGKSDGKISFMNEKIKFIDSDHRVSNDRNSHFIQFADIILGLFYNSFHYTNTKRHGTELTGKLSPMFDGIINNPWDRESKYRYVHRVDFDFFPKLKISDESRPHDIERIGLFYKNRPIIFQHKDELNLF